MNYEDNFDYAKGRLVGTLVSYKGEVVKVLSLIQGAKKIIAEIETPSAIKEVGLVDLNLEPIPTGWGKTRNGNWGFYFRIPARIFKQGLCANNCCKFNPANGILDHDVFSVAEGQKIYNKEYLTKEEAFKLGGAFSRNFCWLKGVLYHKTMAVATKKDGQIEWQPRFKYLESRMEKTL